MARMGWVQKDRAGWWDSGVVGHGYGVPVSCRYELSDELSYKDVPDLLLTALARPGTKPFEPFEQPLHSIHSMSRESNSGPCFSLSLLQ